MWCQFHLTCFFFVLTTNNGAVELNWISERCGFEIYNWTKRKALTNWSGLKLGPIEGCFDKGRVGCPSSRSCSLKKKIGPLGVTFVRSGEIPRAPNAVNHHSDESIASARVFRNRTDRGRDHGNSVGGRRALRANVRVVAQESETPFLDVYAADHSTFISAFSLSRIILVNCRTMKSLNSHA